MTFTLLQAAALRTFFAHPEIELELDRSPNFRERGFQDNYYVHEHVPETRTNHGPEPAQDPHLNYGRSAPLCLLRRFNFTCYTLPVSYLAVSSLCFCLADQLFSNPG